MSKSANVYQAQDRGQEQSYDDYLAAMDAVSVEKVASASAFYNPTSGGTIVDVGMASGTSSQILALLFPQLNIIGVDINPKMIDIANEKYNLPNLSFRLDDGETLKTFEPDTISGFFNCSSIHHITSFNNYDTYRAFHALQRQVELLHPGGILVVRDFVKPPNIEVILELSIIHQDKDISDAELLLMFSKQARSLAVPEEKGFPVKELKTRKKNCRRFKLFYVDAVEFIRRKDYYSDWEIELQEEYAYFSQKEFEDIFASLGLRIILSAPIYNPWIIHNRYRNKFTIYDMADNDIGFPPTNYIISGEKVKPRGTRLKPIRHLPEAETPFLNYYYSRDKKTLKTFDVVQRPNSVVDFLPYSFSDNRLVVLAKNGYPRPVLNAETDSTTIDHKNFGGYIIEGITAAGVSEPLKEAISTRINLPTSKIKDIESALTFFTSPGGIDEKVTSYHVELNKLPTQVGQWQLASGFKDSGTIWQYDALQLLKTAQTGALAEARLELNIYSLMHKLNYPLPRWLGEKIEIEEASATCSITPLENVLRVQQKAFKSAGNTAGYLQKHRVKFIESGISESSSILEYVIPDKQSINTLSTLPVISVNNEIVVGLEIRQLPVPQQHYDNSAIPVVPACRLDKSITNYKQLENMMTGSSLFGTGIKKFFKLGEKYYPSVGVTPEQVYPYVVILEKPLKKFSWVRLAELIDNQNQLLDGHLLITINRLAHALEIV